MVTMLLALPVTHVNIEFHILSHKNYVSYTASNNTLYKNRGLATRD